MSQKEANWTVKREHVTFLSRGPHKPESRVRKLLKRLEASTRKMRSILLTLVDAAAWILLPLALALLVGTTAGRPGRPEKDDMMPHGELMKCMQ